MNVYDKENQMVTRLSGNLWSGSDGNVQSIVTDDYRIF